VRRWPLRHRSEDVERQVRCARVDAEDQRLLPRLPIAPASTDAGTAAVTGRFSGCARRRRHRGSHRRAGARARRRAPASSLLDELGLVAAMFACRDLKRDADCPPHTARRCFVRFPHASCNSRAKGKRGTRVTMPQSAGSRRAAHAGIESCQLPWRVARVGDGKLCPCNARGSTRGRDRAWS
jgi:hypothetical protein